MIIKSCQKDFEVFCVALVTYKLIIIYEIIVLFFYSNSDCDPEMVIMADSADQLQ